PPVQEWRFHPLFSFEESFFSPRFFAFSQYNKYLVLSRLYIVATPIGNLEDITRRAISTLKATPILFAEDTRETRKLLELCGIPQGGKKIFSYSSHNLKEATESAVNFLLEGKDV